MEKEENLNLRRTTKEINQEKFEKRKKKFKKWLIISSIIIIVILIIAFIIYWSIDNKSEKGQVDDLDKAIQNKDTDKLSDMVKTEGNTLPKSDAKHLINYFNQKNNKSHYQKEIKEIKDTINNGTQTDSTLGEITDKRGKPVITISKDGINSFFFKKLAFTPHYRTVYIDSKTDDSTYQFDNKGKQTSTVASNKLSKLGSFMIGEYTFSANKHFKDASIDIDDSVSGDIHINTDKVNGKGQIIAQEYFPQAWFKVKLDNTKELDNDYNLYINDKRVNYSKNETYGAYPTDVPLKIKATGKINDKTINTNEVDIESNKDDSTQNITLKFDNKAIQKEVEKDKAIKKDAQTFLKDYTEELSHSYKESTFNGLRKYFKDSNSDVAKNIKKQVLSKKKNQYSEPKFKSYKKDDDEVIIVLEKEDEQDNTITSRYTLEYDGDRRNKFKIKAYTDI